MSRHPHRTLLLSLLLAASLPLLGSCGGRQQQEAERERQAREAARMRELDGRVSRCKQQQEKLQQLADQLASSQGALSRLAQRGYSPAPRPQAPDPAVLQRYTVSDQELELERHQEAVRLWEASEAIRRQRWQAELGRERAALNRRLSSARQAMAALNPALVRDNTVQSELLETYLTCERQALAQVPEPAAVSAAVSSSGADASARRP
jgi:hypothetical protein